MKKDCSKKLPLIFFCHTGLGDCVAIGKNVIPNECDESYPINIISREVFSFPPKW